MNIIGANANSILSFVLGDGAPVGATIEPETGVFSWTPLECQGAGVYTIPIYVVDYGNNEANDLGFVKVTVNEVNLPPWLLPGKGAAYVGQTNSIALCGGDPDCPPNPLTYSLLGSVPSGLTIDAATGTLTWAPTAAQAGTNYLVEVRLCDGGSPNYCVTNTVDIAVTTNAPFWLDVQHPSGGTLRFTIHNGRTDEDYVLQQATSICECPCQTVWQDVLPRVSPSTMPFTFLYTVPNMGQQSATYFRLYQVPR